MESVGNLGRSTALKSAFILALSALFASPSALAHKAKNSVVCNAPSGVPSTSLLLLGELHGSKESPKLAGEIVCGEALKAPVVLALEIPTTEQSPVDRFLASNGGAGAKAELLSHQFWQADVDGRASAAMFELIAYMRKLKHAGLPVSVFAFARGGARRHITRQAALADSLRDFVKQHPNLSMVVLTGNVHGSQAPFLQFGNGPKIIPTGYLIRDLHPVSVLIAHPTGTIWACINDSCNVHPIKGGWGATLPPAHFHDQAPMEGYGISYMLRHITASPPAVSGLRHVSQ